MIGGLCRSLQIRDEPDLRPQITLESALQNLVLLYRRKGQYDIHPPLKSFRPSKEPSLLY